MATLAATAVSAAVAAPLTTAATLATGYASYAQTRAANKAAMANAESVSEQQKQVEKQGLQAEAKQRQQVGAIIGKQKTGYAAAGVALGGGTPAAIEQETEQLGEADALTLRSNTQSRLQALESQRRGYMASVSNPWMSAGTTVLTNAVGGLKKTSGSLFKGDLTSGKAFPSWS